MMSIMVPGQPASVADARELPMSSLATLLRDAHRELEESIDTLAKVTDTDDCPAPHLLAQARWRLSAANRTRSMIVMQAVRALRPRADQAQSIDLDRVSRLADQLREFTRGYVQKWTPASVIADWSGYRRASREKRDLLASSVKLERAVLYPPLDRLVL